MEPNATFALSAAPTEWASYADELKEAADILWRDSESGLLVSSGIGGRLLKKSHVSRSSLLLAGFALENVFKGLMIAADPTLVQGGKLNNKITHHNLLSLAAAAQQVLTPAEKKFCAVVQQATPYWGKYPVPLKADDLLEEVPMDQSHADVFHTLFVRTRRALYESVRNGWGPVEGVSLSSSYDSRFDAPLPAK